MKGKASNAGFSLIEIMLAIAIAAMMMGVIVVSMRARFDAQARRAANKLTGVIHFLYNQAGTGAKTYRLAFQLDRNDTESQRFWVEVGEGNAMIAPESEEKTRSTPARRSFSEGGKHEAQTTKKVEEEKDATNHEPQTTNPEETSDTEEQPPSLQSPTQTDFTRAFELPHRLNQEMRLSGKVIIHDICTAQRKEPFTEGTAYIYFFSQGYAEPATINLSNADGDKFLAIVINPLTGFTKVYPERKECGK